LTRGLLIAAGLLCVALGVVGLVLPLLPTTPFMLLAAACFARSSPRFHAWLLGHRWFGPPIRDWQQYRAIRPPVKRRVTLLVLISFGLSLLLVQQGWVRLLLLVLMTGLLLFIWRTRDGDG
jgi:hypothetical protein